MKPFDFLAFLVFTGVLALAIELPVDIAGDAASLSDSALDSSTAMTVSLTNEYEHDIDLYYVHAHDHVESFMGNIAAGGEYNMNTFTGHSFMVKRGEDPLSTFLVVRGEHEVFLRPSSSAPLSTAAGAAAPKQRRHPNIIDIPGRRTSATAVIFRSLSTRHMQIWYDDGSPTGSFSGDFLPAGQSTTNAYLGHKFFFTDKHNSSHRVATIEINSDHVLYVIRDDAEHEVSQELMEQTEREELFMAQYLLEHGIHWRHHYGKDGPRPPPSLHMWPTDAIGQTHKVESLNGHWSCLEKATCQSTAPLSLELEVVSLAPKVFYISDFLHDFEADHIISQARHTVAVSKVGDSATGFSSDTRTSRNSWIPRSKNALIDSLYRRAADVLGVDEAMLTMSRCAEELQVVHYQNNQKYEAHHDWGASMNHPNSRMITMLMYLTDQEDPPNGGETSFPKGGTGAGFKVKPVKGDAVLFYNLLEDGNGDDLSLHAALPVTSGEKWLANFWVWDPIKSLRD